VIGIIVELSDSRLCFSFIFSYLYLFSYLGLRVRVIV